MHHLSFLWLEQILYAVPIKKIKNTLQVFARKDAQFIFKTWNNVKSKSDSFVKIGKVKFVYLYFSNEEKLISR